MAITDNGTAAAVNTVLGFLLPSTREPWQGKVELEDAIEAAERLASAAHKQMGAGVSACRVRQAAAVDGVRLQAVLRG